jgi:hypothetical protein
MNYFISLKFQWCVLHVAAIVIGAISIWSAVRQLQTGRTYYKGEITAEEQPIYFVVLFLMRFLVGLAALVLGVLLPWPR